MRLPYDNTCPVIHDNDTVIDVYTEEYLMALASTGDIQFVGLITSSSIAPYNRFVPEEDFESDAPVQPDKLNFVKNRAHGVRLARESGFGNLPEPVMGIKGHLEKPPSGEIDDTQPHDTPGTRLIIETARACTPEKPLVVIMGGPVSVAVDAYLLDPSIADRMVITWLGGSRNGADDYNGACDWWAAYIAACRLNVVQFPTGYNAPRTPRERLTELPDTPFRTWLIAQRHPNQQAHVRDGDGQPAVCLMRPDAVVAARRMTFDHWGTNGRINVPTEPCAFYREDPTGNILVVTEFDQDIATEEWWRAMTNPAAWHHD